VEAAPPAPPRVRVRPQGRRSTAARVRQRPDDYQGRPRHTARLVFALCDRLDGCFNTERRQQPHNSGSPPPIDPQSAERDTGSSTGIAPGGVTIIAADITLGAIVADKQPAAAMATA